MNSYPGALSAPSGTFPKYDTENIDNGKTRVFLSPIFIIKVNKEDITLSPWTAYYSQIRVN